MSKATDYRKFEDFKKIMELVGKEFNVDTCQHKSATFSYPALDKDGNEMWVSVTVSVPTGERDGDGFDGYTESENYKFECAEKEKKAKAKAEQKAKKIAQDEKARAEKKRFAELKKAEMGS